VRKSERLFQLVTLLQGRRTAVTAQALAEKLEVNVRTVYRDMQTLMQAGVPIEGEAGVGYWLHKGFALPPLMFQPDEITALLAGSRMVQAWTDPKLAEAARRAEQKILAVLPAPVLDDVARLPYRIPNYANPEAATHGLLRTACEARRKVAIDYRDMKNAETTRTLWPLGMIGWGDHWTLLAWCELRDEYRNFRFDRILNIELLDERYPVHRERNLEHYITKVVGMEDEQKPA